MSAGSPTRILLADDNRELVAMLASYLVSQGHVVKCVEAAAEALRVLETDEFDVVMADIYMPGNEDFQLLEVLNREHPELPVIIMTGYPTVVTAVAALRGAAVDYLSKPFALTTVDTAIETARRVRVQRTSIRKMRELARGFLLDDVDALARDKETSNRALLLAKLTARERDVVDKIILGKRPDEVADALSISPHRVRSHLKSVYRKLSVNSQVELLSKIGLAGS